MYYITDFTNLDEDIDIFYSKMKVTGSKIEFYSRKEMKICNLLKEEYNLPSSFCGSPLTSYQNSPFLIAENSILFHQSYDGAMFNIDIENKVLQHRYQWDFGSHTFDVSCMNKNNSTESHMDFLNSEGKKYALVFHFAGENNKYILTNFIHQQKPDCLLYDKSNKSVLLINKFKEGFGYGTNWLDDSHIYGIVPSNFLSYIPVNILDDKNREIYHSVKEDDNPIVFRCKFK